MVAAWSPARCDGRQGNSLRQAGHASGRDKATIAALISTKERANPVAPRGHRGPRFNLTIDWHRALKFVFSFILRPDPAPRKTPPDS